MEIVLRSPIGPDNRATSATTSMTATTTTMTTTPATKSAVIRQKLPSEKKQTLEYVLREC